MRKYEGQDRVVGPGGKIRTYTLAELKEQAADPYSDPDQFAREFARRGLRIEDHVDGKAK